VVVTVVGNFGNDMTAVHLPDGQAWARYTHGGTVHLCCGVTQVASSIMVTLLGYILGFALASSCSEVCGTHVGVVCRGHSMRVAAAATDVAVPQKVDQ
jgi:hypothetical protein